jgi:hypothetical protein
MSRRYRRSKRYTVRAFSLRYGYVKRSFYWSHHADDAAREFRRDGFFVIALC